MKRNVFFEAIGLIIGVFFSFYLLAAFGEWQINPGEWRDETRGIVAGVGGVFSLFAGFMRIVLARLYT